MRLEEIQPRDMDSIPGELDARIHSAARELLAKRRERKNAQEACQVRRREHIQNKIETVMDWFRHGLYRPAYPLAAAVSLVVVLMVAAPWRHSPDISYGWDRLDMYEQERSRASSEKETRYENRLSGRDVYEREWDQLNRSPQEKNYLDSREPKEQNHEDITMSEPQE